MTSADSRRAAVSKLSRVRVESSKNSDTTVLPRSAGTLGMARELTSTKLSVRRRTSSIPRRPRSAIDSRCRPSAAHRGLTSPITTPASLTSTISSRRVGRLRPT